MIRKCNDRLWGDMPSRGSIKVLLSCCYVTYGGLFVKKFFRKRNQGFAGSIISGSHHGFTMIELMVSVAVLSIGAMIAIPNTLVWVDNQRLASAARELRSVLEEAKYSAIKEGALAIVQLAAESREYRVFVDTGDTDGTWDSSDTSLNEGTLDDSVTMTLSMNGNENEFRFNRMGLVESGYSGSVILKNDSGRTYRVRVKTAGVIRVE